MGGPRGSAQRLFHPGQPGLREKALRRPNTPGGAPLLGQGPSLASVCLQGPTPKHPIAMWGHVLPAPPHSLLPPRPPTSSSRGVPRGLAVQSLARLRLRARGPRSFPLSASTSTLRPTLGPDATPTILQGPERTQEPGRAPAFSVLPQPVSSWDPALPSGRPEAHGPRVTSWLTFGEVVDALLAARVPGEQQGRGLGARVQQRQQEALVPRADQPRSPHQNQSLIQPPCGRAEETEAAEKELGERPEDGLPSIPPWLRLPCAEDPSGCGDAVCVNTRARGARRPESRGRGVGGTPTASVAWSRAGSWWSWLLEEQTVRPPPGALAHPAAFPPAGPRVLPLALQAGVLGAEPRVPCWEAAAGSAWPQRAALPNGDAFVLLLFFLKNLKTSALPKCFLFTFQKEK